VSPAGLIELDRRRLEFGPEVAAVRLAALAKLARTRLASARDVLRLHEVLCVARAYPDNAQVLSQVEAMLARFAARADLRAHRAALADSGVAGTDVRYRFFYGQARWLAERWPAQLRLDRGDEEAANRIARALRVLLTATEAHALAELELPGYAALDRVRDARVTDAAFLLGRIGALPGNGFTREQFSDEIDATFVLRPGGGTPSRSTARFGATRVAFQRSPLARARPDVRAELARPPRALRRSPPDRAAELIDLARGAMVLRQRSMESFSYGDAHDVWLAGDRGGLAFALIGVVAERRHAVAASYGTLTLRNGVPLGYGQADVVGRSAALSFNTFDTFRGADAAFTFARLLAALRHAFGVTSFTLDGYQLGKGNDEGIESGAWWFYRKLGFVPRDAAALRLAATEEARVRSNPKHRSSRAALRKLAEHRVFFDLDPQRPHPLPPLVPLGMRVARLLSERGGADRQAAVEECSRDALRRCGVESLRGFTSAERDAWRRWAPIVALLDVEGWSRAERSALADVIRAKAARSERDYVERYNAHPRLDAALLAAAAP